MKRKVVSQSYNKINRKRVPYTQPLHKKKRIRHKKGEIDMFDGNGAVIALAIVGIIAMILVLPFFSFWLSYFGGWIAKFLIGKQLVAGFAYLGITLPIDKIPLMAGTLGYIGGFFKSVGAIRNTNN